MFDLDRPFAHVHVEVTNRISDVFANRTTPGEAVAFEQLLHRAGQIGLAVERPVGRRLGGRCEQPDEARQNHDWLHGSP